ncbi:Hypothetical protein A7982_01356 [Minicystis rosea]|nr:Hypothetical protein A7982_01356 [Minicystis rosea]
MSPPSSRRARRSWGQRKQDEPDPLPCRVHVSFARVRT